MADDELDDRLSRRFESSPNDEDKDQSEKSENDMSSTSPQKDRNAQSSQKAKNIKEEWNVRSFYLSDDLDGRLSTAFKRLDLDLSESDNDIDLKKTRHFYPLLVELGLERLEEMDVTEVTERLESKDSV
jgi:hypothetical protein